MFLIFNLFYLIFKYKSLNAFMEFIAGFKVFLLNLWLLDHFYFKKALYGMGYCIKTYGFKYLT